jgi:di/tricarboxylate transporter
MSFELVLTLGVVGFALIGLILDLLSPDAIFIGGLVIVTLGGVIDLETAMEGFGNPTLLALGSLYVVAAALRETGALDAASQFVLGKGQNVRRLLLRMTPSVTIYSAFLNNTPVVAMGIPAIRGWCKRHGVSPSKLLMPLSFASIFGGICTLIGTSTNLVVHGLLQSHGLPGFSFFELAWVGVPCALVGLVYVIFIAPSMLQDRVDIRAEEEEERAELVEVELAANSPLVGETVEQNELEFLPGLVLVSIERGGREIAPVEETETLQAGDRLLFAPMQEAGPQATAPDELDLAPYPGLRLALTDIETDEDRELHQVVVREGSSLIGERVGEVGFLERFGAAVTGLRRGGKRLSPPFGDVTLQPGDTLLLDTERGFREAFEESEEFFVTSEAGGETEKTDEEAEQQRKAMRTDTDRSALWLSVAVIISIVTVVTAGWMHIAVAGSLGAVLLIGAGVINPGEARESIDWNVLIVIGAALGIGQAMEASGAAQLIGEGVVGATQTLGPYGILAGIVVATTLLTNVVTNNGAVALMFPVALSVAESQGFDPRALMVSMTLAGSLALITPIGYQTNLMVYGPGNYTFFDFTRVGGPLQVLLWAVIIVVAPLVWAL